MEILKMLGENYRLEEIRGEHFIIFKHEDGGQDFVSVNTLKNLDIHHHKDYDQGFLNLNALKDFYTHNRKEMRDWLLENHPEMML